MSVLLDTGLVFAFLNKRDANHARAFELMLCIANKDFGTPFVTDTVMFELFTLIRSRTGSMTLEESARRFLPLPSPSLSGLTAVSLGTEHLESVWEVFRKYRDQGISFTDAGLIVTMREMGFDRLATLDARLRGIVPCAE